MACIVIKPEPDRDLYVCWSTGVEAPAAAGDRTLMRQHLTEYHANNGDPDERLTRADINGTSATGGYAFFGRWDCEGLAYEQRGILPRRHLARAVELLDAGREAEVWDLLEPFEGDREVRRG